ncbi:phosphate transporter 2-1 [Medicago truncatula]|uniref:Phosphate transporter 2-1 n=1 Tax=Medicago truncatula TaxID=3880 RepID=G7ISA6_MEDTR|nr:phosphate transporter 2-1 [Medicago truncatula]
MGITYSKDTRTVIRVRCLFAADSIVLFVSNLGLPISATHTMVGAVMGVGIW